MEPRILLGSVFAPPDDPCTRLLVARHWPRGIARGAVDQWEPQLAPPEDAGDDPAAEARYRAQLLARPSLLDWAARMAVTNGVVLLCATPAGSRCGCAVLADVLRERLGA